MIDRAAAGDYEAALVPMYRVSRLRVGLIVT
jgi:hypothetical protein